MNEDKIIADYIRTRYPQMLCTTDFTMYKFGAQVGSAFRCLVDSFNKSYNSLTEKQEQSTAECGEEEQNEVDSEEDN